VQRAAIARAFILQPDVLLMDEPFSALDEITRDEARELFLRVWKQIKPTTVLVTHSIVEALYLGNTIIVMGEHMGDVKYQMQNAYYGDLYPENAEYLLTKKLLRDKLKIQDERKETFE
jgi:NitT/TauT family transport system ATP-binding protein